MTVHADLKSIEAQIFKLDPDELSHLKRRIDTMLTAAGRKTSGHLIPSKDHDADEHWMLAEICSVLQSRGLGVLYPARLRTMRGMDAFREKLPALAGYIKRAAPKQIQRRAIFRLGVELLYDNLVEMNVPITEVTLLGHIHRLPAVLDVHFPGYAASGMLAWIIREVRTPRTRA